MCRRSRNSSARATPRNSPTHSDEDLRVRLVVGLGNPGSRYARTRHNAGQLVVERLAERHDVRRFTSKFAGRFAEISTSQGPVGLLIPTTFMNLSGDSAGPAAGALRAGRSQVLVVHDELDLPFSVVRAKRGGGSGGHNGLRSLTERLGGPDYLRVRLGIGRPPPAFRGDQADWVLMGFNEPAAQVSAMVDRGVQLVEAILGDGIDAAIARFHASEPGARARERRLRKDAERREREQAGSEAEASGPEAPGDQGAERE